MYQGQVNARGFYSLANYYYQNRTDYIWHLDNARFNSRSDLTPFIVFGLTGLVNELQAVHAQVINEVKWISLRDFARERISQTGKLGTKSGERLFLLLAALGRDPIAISELRASASPVAILYRKLHVRTVQRDIAALKELGLIQVQGGEVVTNLDVMDRFTALQEIQANQRRGLSP